MVFLDDAARRGRVCGIWTGTEQTPEDHEEEKGFDGCSKSYYNLQDTISDAVRLTVSSRHPSPTIWC